MDRDRRPPDGIVVLGGADRTGRVGSAAAWWRSTTAPSGSPRSPRSRGDYPNARIVFTGGNRAV